MNIVKKDMQRVCVTEGDGTLKGAPERRRRRR